MAGRNTDLVRDLATGLREVVLPMLGAREGRAHDRTGASGDVTFAIDTEAEAFLTEWVAANAPDVAFYSEDQGLVGPEHPELVLVVDPIDGTRPALAGLESACTSVAIASARDGAPRMRDVVAGAVVEIKSGDWFVAERGGGLGSSRPVRLSDNERLDRLFWAHGFARRPAEAMVRVIGELIDLSSLGGGTFDLGSAAFDLTRIASGQLDAYVEPGARMVREVPGMPEAFARVGDGQIVNNSPYDVAAAALCLTEAGAVVTDASGAPLDAYPLLGSGPEFHVSCVAAANPVLHARLLEAVERGMDRLRAAGYGP